MSRRIEPHDLLLFRFLSAPRFSPNGKHIAFAVHRMDSSQNKYLSDLWIHDIALKKTRQLTSSGYDKTFCWSEDGTHIFFVSDRPRHKEKDAHGKSTNEKEAKKLSRLYHIAVDGGEALPLAVVPEPVSALWPLDGNRLLLKTIHEPEEAYLEEADYVIFRQIPFCSNGKGFTGQKRATLSIFSIAEEELKRISPEGMDVGQVRLAKDRKKALAVGAVFSDVLPDTNCVWEFDLKSGASEELLPQGKLSCYCADAFDGGILLTATDMKQHGRNENARFYLLRNGSLSCLTPQLDRGLRNSIVCDCRYGLSDMNLAFLTDSERAWFVSTDRYKSHLHTLDAAGNITQATQNLSTVDDFDIMGGCIAAVRVTDLSLQELYLIENGLEQRLTDFNHTTMAEFKLSVPEPVTLANGTPWDLDCWYMRPVDFKVGKKYPTILHIHGGPKMTFGDVFVHEMQYWAAEGYAVLFCNPRGSDGKGNGFDDIRGLYGTVDYDDLMTFTDWAIKTLPFVDGDRMGVTGGSYGGFMTNWIIGHTDRFQAAVTQRSICNWVSMAGISDIGYFFVPDQQAADIWSDVDKLWWHSPLKYADQIKTPTLVIHSDEDHRCEISQGLQLFTALKRHGVDSKICMFKGENHELSRSGSPKSRFARMREITQWFKEWL